MIKNELVPYECSFLYLTKISLNSRLDLPRLRGALVEQRKEFSIYRIFPEQAKEV